MIHDEICTYEVCKLAKEKGFREKCIAHYYDDTKDLYRSSNPQCYNWGGNTSDAPTQSLLQRWLRKEREYAISVFWDMLSKAYYYEIIKTIGVLEIQVGEKYNYSNPKGFDTYELALEDALKYALENLV